MSQFIVSVVILCLSLRTVTLNAEWVDIRPMSSSDDDTLHVHFNDQMLSPLQQSFSATTATTTAAPQNPFTIYDRVGLAISVLPRPLSSDSPPESATIVPPIRYEDLEHIVGPGFEAELEKFYEQHKHELDESTRRSDVTDSMGSSNGNNTSGSSKPPKIYYVPGDDDPWSQYDKPMLTAQQHSSSTEKSADESDSSAHSAPMVTNNRTANTTASTTSTKKRIVKLVPLRVVAVPADSMQKQTSGVGGFPGVVAFLRGIQDSIVSNTSRSIKDKMRMLESLRDKMMLQIKKNIRSLWPSSSTQKRSSRTKREAESSYGGHSMDFPSSEGALMTISFLTFAVFLIKLVLQVINTIKSKHYSYNSFDTVNTGGTVTALNVIKQNRNARHVSLSDDGLDAALTPGGLNIGSVLQAMNALQN